MATITANLGNHLGAGCLYQPTGPQLRRPSASAPSSGEPQATAGHGAMPMGPSHSLKPLTGGSDRPDATNKTLAPESAYATPAVTAASLPSSAHALQPELAMASASWRHATAEGSATALEQPPQLKRNASHNPTAPFLAGVGATVSAAGLHLEVHDMAVAQASTAAIAAAGIAVPEYFLCPITLELMQEPTISKCGHMFDRDAIIKWMKGEYDPSRLCFSRTCPVCHKPIDESSLSPCYPIKNAIGDWLHKQEAIFAAAMAAGNASPKQGGSAEANATSPAIQHQQHQQQQLQAASTADRLKEEFDRSGKGVHPMISLFRGKLKIGKKSSQWGNGTVAAGIPASINTGRSVTGAPDAKGWTLFSPCGVGSANSASVRTTAQTAVGPMSASFPARGALGSSGDAPRSDSRQKLPDQSQQQDLQRMIASDILPLSYSLSQQGNEDELLSGSGRHRTQPMTQPRSVSQPGFASAGPTSGSGGAGGGAGGVSAAPSASDWGDVAGPRVPMWARLVPYLHLHSALDLDREKFLIGRHASCHARLNLSEVSSRHAYIWRQRANDGLWHIFLEDRSTNGTFVNGRTVGKCHRRRLCHGDDIAFGRKTASRKDPPEVDSFLDWVFVGTLLATEHKSSIDRAKQIPTFSLLCTMDDAALSEFGVTDATVRGTIITATKTWTHDHRFPAYRLELVDPVQYASAESPAAAVFGNPVDGSRSEEHTNQSGNGSSGGGEGQVVSPTLDHRGPSDLLRVQGGNNALTPSLPLPPRRSPGELANGLEELVARLSLSGTSLVANMQTSEFSDYLVQLRRQFPRLDSETVQVVIQYERIMGLTRSFDEFHMRCVVKLAELTARRIVQPTSMLPPNLQTGSSAGSGGAPHAAQQLPPPVPPPLLSALPHSSTANGVSMAGAHAEGHYPGRSSPPMPPPTSLTLIPRSDSHGGGSLGAGATSMAHAAASALATSAAGGADVAAAAYSGIPGIPQLPACTHVQYLMQMTPSGQQILVPMLMSASQAPAVPSQFSNGGCGTVRPTAAPLMMMPTQFQHSVSAALPHVPAAVGSGCSPPLGSVGVQAEAADVVGNGGKLGGLVGAPDPAGAVGISSGAIKTSAATNSCAHAYGASAAAQPPQSHRSGDSPRASHGVPASAVGKGPVSPAFPPCLDTEIPQQLR